MSASGAEAGWCGVTVWCEDWRAAERLAVSHLAPLLAAAERTDRISLWWFTRKAASWRIRWLPGPGQADRVSASVAFGGPALLGMLADSAVQRWAPAVYEPETQAFGGPAAMDIAHRLFHADSRHVLAHLGRSCPEHRRELGIVLAATLLRAAGLDYYEQGDVWARVAAHRTARRPPPPDPTAQAAMRRLLTASVVRPLEGLPDWPAAFHQTGQSLAGLTDRGELTRGVRAVIAHHILFAWNRLGLPTSDQAQLAGLAARTTFDP